MKLRNKRTGKVVEVSSCNSGCGKIRIYYDEEDGRIGTSDSYNSLAELNAEWEDYEEPKEYWYLSGRGEIRCIEDDDTEFDKDHKKIGNYFESEEEAEKAVEKLKAYKRLRDKGMIKYSFHKEKTGIDLDFYTLTILAPRDKDSLDLLFGGEE